MRSAATQLTRSPLLPASRIRQSIAHARRLKSATTNQRRLLSSTTPPKWKYGGTCWPDWIILHIQWGSFSSQRRLRYFALLLELKDRSGVVGYTVVIFSAHLVPVKWEFFTTSSTMEIQLCARPATQLTHSPYFRQIAYASPLRMREDLSERVYKSAETIASRILNVSGASRIRPIVRVLSLVGLFWVCAVSCSPGVGDLLLLLPGL